MYRPIYRAVFGANWTKNKRYTTQRIHSVYLRLWSMNKRSLLMMMITNVTMVNGCAHANAQAEQLVIAMHSFSVFRFLFIRLSFFCFAWVGLTLFQFFCLIFFRCVCPRDYHILFINSNKFYIIRIICNTPNAIGHCSDLNVSINACCWTHRFIL